MSDQSGYDDFDWGGIGDGDAPATTAPIAPPVAAPAPAPAPAPVPKAAPITTN